MAKFCHESRQRGILIRTINVQTAQADLSLPSNVRAKLISNCWGQPPPHVGLENQRNDAPRIYKFAEFGRGWKKAELMLGIAWLSPNR
jgi:hypothetical protein